MPLEITSKERLQELLPKATEIRIVKGKDGVKMKLRTKDVLYTFKTTGEEADKLTKGIKTPVIDF